MTLASVTVTGVVLRLANYRDHDRMLSILSPELGRIEVLSRGCRRPRSALMPGSELFVHGEFVLFQSNERFMVTSCMLTDTFYPLRLEPYHFTCASYMTALCHAAAQPNEPAAELFALLLRGLYLLTYDTSVNALAQTTAFLMLFADAIGYRPRLTRCAHCHVSLEPDSDGWFDVAAGGLCCASCASRTTFALSAEQIAWMKLTLKQGLSAQTEKSADTLFDVLRRYVEMRLETVLKVSHLLP